MTFGSERVEEPEILMPRQVSDFRKVDDTPFVLTKDIIDQILTSAIQKSEIFELLIQEMVREVAGQCLQEE